ncbi:MAG TPA: hypothetical protein VJ836_00645 [Candidatus Saccharimonadales bacterium]|nr:hypothetical protein [Candidatus Saccharimonadales bacterium]
MDVKVFLAVFSGIFGAFFFFFGLIGIFVCADDKRNFITCINILACGVFLIALAAGIGAS